MNTGDIIWILTQLQLRAVSRLVQSLMDAAVRTQQATRGADSDRDSTGSLESLSSDVGSQKSDSKADREAKQRKGRTSKLSSNRKKAAQERVAQYREGKVNLPAHEVIQNSFHIKTGKVDLQLCDDTSESGVSDTVQGSMLIQVQWMAGKECHVGIVCCHANRCLICWWTCTWSSQQVLAGHTGTKPMTS